MPTEAEILDILSWSPIDHKIRIEKEFARKILLEDTTVLSNGDVYHLEIAEIGLDVFFVKKAECGVNGNYLKEKTFSLDSFLKRPIGDFLPSSVVLGSNS